MCGPATSGCALYRHEGHTTCYVYEISSKVAACYYRAIVLHLLAQQSSAQLLCRSYAKGFAFMGFLYSGCECLVEKSRAKHDKWNATYAGCATGAVMAVQGDSYCSTRESRALNNLMSPIRSKCCINVLVQQRLSADEPASSSSCADLHACLVTCRWTQSHVFWVCNIRCFLDCHRVLHWRPLNGSGSQQTAVWAVHCGWTYCL